MPLFGTLKSMPLPDLLQWIGTSRATGTLQLERAKVRKSICLRDGIIVGCMSDDPPQKLGQFLLARGSIDEQTLSRALQEQTGKRRPLGEILVEMKAILPDDLTRYLESQAEETIFSLFDWEDAVFRFNNELNDEDVTFAVQLRVDDVLLRGVQRYDEMRRIKDTFHNPRIVLSQTGTAPPTAVLDNKMAMTLFEAIDGERTVDDILLHTHGSEFVVKKFLYELHSAGVVAISGLKETPAPTKALPATLPAADDEIPLAAAPEESEPAPSAGPTPVASPVAEASTQEPTPTDPPPTILTATPPVAGPSLKDDDGEPLEDLLANWEPESSSKDNVESVAADLSEAVEATQTVEALEDSKGHQLNTRLEEVRVLMKHGEFEKSLDILDEIYARFPGDESLRRLTAEAEAEFAEKAYRYFLPASKIAVLTKPLADLESETFSPTEFFMISRLDGSWDVRSIIQIAPMREADALRTLKRLRESGVIELKDPEPS